MGKARALAREFQTHIDDLMRESEVDEMKREFNEMTRPPDFSDLEDDLMAAATQRSRRPPKSPPPLEQNPWCPPRHDRLR